VHAPINVLGRIDSGSCQQCDFTINFEVIFHFSNVPMFSVMTNLTYECVCVHPFVDYIIPGDGLSKTSLSNSPVPTKTTSAKGEICCITIGTLS